MSAGLASPVLTGEGTWRAARKKDGHVSFQRLPLEPLAQALDRHGGYDQVARRLDDASRVRVKRSWARAKVTSSLTWKAADQLAIELLLLHPCEIWGTAWFELQD
jgi:hypothetical protein